MGYQERLIGQLTQSVTSDSAAIVEGMATGMAAEMENPSLYDDAEAERIKRVRPVVATAEDIVPDEIGANGVIVAKQTEPEGDLEEMPKAIKPQRKADHE